MTHLLKITLFCLGLALFSCKKEWTCECVNSNATYDAGTVEKTKSQAKKYCKDLSSGQTTCQLKN